MSSMTFEDMFANHNLFGEVSKKRDNFAEIVDVLGIDFRLLKNNRDGTDPNHTGKLPWRLPEESIPFVKWILEDYISKEFKYLRKADFCKVSIRTLKQLVDGFCSMLGYLGYDERIVKEQRMRMNARLHFSRSSSRKEVDSTIKELTDTLDEYEKNFLNMNDNEITIFYDFLKNQIKEMLSYIQELYITYIDIRNDEFTDQALEESAHLDYAEMMNRINQNILIQDFLDKDCEYKKLETERQRLLNNGDFIRKKKKCFEKVCAEMESIRHEYEVNLFGYKIPPEEEMPIISWNPSEILQKAIQYTNECREYSLLCKEKQEKIVIEQREQIQQEYESFIRVMDRYPYELYLILT